MTLTIQAQRTYVGEGMMRLPDFSRKPCLRTFYLSALRLRSYDFIFIVEVIGNVKSDYADV